MLRSSVCTSDARATRTSPGSRAAVPGSGRADLEPRSLQFLQPSSTFAQAAAQVADSARIPVKAGVVHKGAAQVVRGAWHEVGVN
jgi:hypothetical protein